MDLFRARCNCLKNGHPAPDCKPAPIAVCVIVPIVL